MLSSTYDDSVVVVVVSCSVKSSVEFFSPRTVVFSPLLENLGGQNNLKYLDFLENTRVHLFTDMTQYKQFISFLFLNEHKILITSSTVPFIMPNIVNLRSFI